MDYKEEQEQEIEALEAIFAEDLLVLPGEDSQTSRYQLPLVDDESGASAQFEFSFKETYPMEAPTVGVQSAQGIPLTKRAELVKALEEESLNNVGEAMIFSLHSFAKEWMADNLQAGKNDEQEDSNQLQKDEETMFETRDEEEEAKAALKEKMKFHGTPVTAESFAVWQEKFEEEMLAKAQLNAQLEESKKGLTGKQLFEQDKAVVTEESESFWEMEADAFDDDEEEGEEEEEEEAA